MRNLCLAIAFVLTSSVNAWSQESRVDELSGLAVEITSPGVLPFKLYLYKNRKLETNWSGDLPNTPSQSIDDNHKGLNIPIGVIQEGDVVSVDLRVGLESLKEISLATYRLRLDESVTVNEVEPYGFKLFTLKIIRIRIAPPVVIPPLVELPTVDNRLQSIQVIGVDKGESKDQYVVSLRNIGTRNLLDLEIIMPTGGTVH